MATFIVENVIANAGKLSAAELVKLSRTTRVALKKLGHSIRLVQSYVTGGKLHCVYVLTKQTRVTEPARPETRPSNQSPLTRQISDSP